MLCIYLEAPFAVCRTFTAGWYRPTATFLTPSAAYGLLLNVAGIESRLREEEPGHDGRTPASLTRPGLPEVKLALGAPFEGDQPSLPRTQTIYQQLHNYPVGKSAGMPAEWSHGNKNNITPVRREVLSNLRAFLCVDSNAALEERIRRGLAGELNSARYGLPFLGDNQLLPDRLEVLPWPLPERHARVSWYERVTEQGLDGPRPNTTRLTIWIDRTDLSRTTSALFAPRPQPSPEPPPSAWVEIVPPPAPPPKPTRRR
jgi:CRISPR-associated protein Cas5t